MALPVVMAGVVTGKMLGLGLPALLFTILVFVVLLALFFYFFSAKILLRWYHAKEVKDENAHLYETVCTLAQKAAIPAPKVFIVDSAMPNAFATGRNAGHASIVVTTALIELLDAEEIKAVLAYELVQVGKGGTQIKTIVAVLSGVLMAPATFAFWCSIFTGFGQEDDPAPNLIKFFVTSLVAPVAAAVIQLVVPRSRAYEAELQSARIHVNADKLARASQKIEAALKSDTFAVNPAHVHLFIMNPLHDGEFTVMDFRLPTYYSLFRTHPATEDKDKPKKAKKRGQIRVNKTTVF